MNNQRFTYAGHPDGEKIVRETLSEITARIVYDAGKGNVKALVLLGGYGKGEGGLIFKLGAYRPHNNFDLLLILSDSQKGKASAIKEAVDETIRSLEEELDIGIDISVMTESKFRSMPTRVFTYDMQEGHRTLYGDSSLVSSIERSLSDVPSWDVRNLMVNRGSLLLINQLCLSLLDKCLDSNHQIKKLIIKHTMKAIIGYGDAVLFFNGNYHWSYEEKQKRLLGVKNVSLNFIRLYQDAMNFRFSPKYEYYFNFDLKKWQAGILDTLRSVHLMCESKRLGHDNIQLDEYLELALSAIPTQDGLTTRSVAKSAFNFMKSHKGVLPIDYCLISKIGYHSSNNYDLTPVLFPLIAFSPTAKCLPINLQMFLYSHFNSNQGDRMGLIKHYLKDWGHSFDPNLWAVLDKHQINLQTEAA